MTESATLSWFARHELTLAWRDWAAMMAGGRTTRERAMTTGTLVFAGLMHLLAYFVLVPFLKAGVTPDKHALLILTAMLLFSFSMMLSQAIEHVTRAFYARADLDLILSSPAAAQHLFSVRIAAIAVSGALMTAVLGAPIINAAAYIDGPKWLSGYLAIFSMSAIATGLSTAATAAMFKAFGPKRTRIIAQVVAAFVGASLVIGLQIAAVLYYGNLSRFEILNSPAVLDAAPAYNSLLWIPARALLGDLWSAIALVSAGFFVLTAAIARYAPEFASNAVSSASVADDLEARGGGPKPFATRTTSQALRAKEWLLLRRDPWILSQSLMQVLYLIPPAILCWKDMGSGTPVHAVLAPVLVMAFGQLAGGLGWLAISGEDAHDLVATAPITERARLRAKIESVMRIIAAVAAPMVLALSFVSLWGAAVTMVGIAASSATAMTIQFWFKATAKRSLFRKRQVATKGATFAEAFSSVFWAAATGFAAAESWFALIFVVFALLSLGAARLIRPRETAA